MAVNPKPLTENDFRERTRLGITRDVVEVDDVLSALAGLREKVDVPNPYPVDVFPEISPKELPLIDDVLRREFGFPLDRLSAFIGRRLFENYKKKTLEDIDYYFQLEGK